MLTGLSMKNGRGSEIEIFGRVKLNTAEPAHLRFFFSLGLCKMLPGRIWPGLLYRGVYFPQVPYDAVNPLKGSVWTIHRFIRWDGCNTCNSYLLQRRQRHI